MTVIGFLGSGSMSQAMARGWAAAGVASGKLLFTDSGSGRAAEIATAVNGEAVAGNRELAERADVLVLACKPKDLAGASREIGRAGVVLSVLGATSLEQVRAVLPAAEVHRAMPNIAVELGVGVTALAESEGPSRLGVRRLLGRLGEVIDLPDSAIDAATAIMGCSPAYFDLMVEELAASGHRAGLDRGIATAISKLTFAGTARLAADREPGEIRRAVASPGGSTEAGLDSLRDHDFGGTVSRAVEASLARMRGEV